MDASDEAFLVGDAGFRPCLQGRGMREMEDVCGPEYGVCFGVDGTACPEEGEVVSVLGNAAVGDGFADPRFVAVVHVYVVIPEHVGEDSGADLGGNDFE